jgi:hypothetical protein
MLNEKNLPNYFWAKAVTTTIYIVNRTPTIAIHGMTPEKNSHVETECVTSHNV